MTKAATIALTMLCSGIIARQALGQVQSPRSISSEIMLAEADTAAMAVLERYAAQAADIRRDNRKSSAPSCCGANLWHGGCRKRVIAP